MTIKHVAGNVYAVPLGGVNAFLIDGAALTLVDTGVPGSEEAILGAVRELGKQPGDVKHILVTHLHADHSGGLAALKRATGAPAYMHAADAAAVRAGQSMRPVHLRPNLPPQFAEMFANRPRTPIQIEPAEIENEVADGETLPFAADLRAGHVPGHAAGQLAFLLPESGGVLFVADAAGNHFGLDYAPIYEDFELGQRSLAKLAALDFAIACFGHGEAITGNAGEQFRTKWGAVE